MACQDRGNEIRVLVLRCWTGIWTRCSGKTWDSVPCCRNLPAKKRQPVLLSGSTNQAFIKLRTSLPRCLLWKFWLIPSRCPRTWMICIGRPCLECRTQSGNSVGENSLLIFSKIGLGEDVSGLFNLLGEIDGTATLFAFFHHEVKPVRRFAGQYRYRCDC